MTSVPDPGLVISLGESDGAANRGERSEPVGRSELLRPGAAKSASGAQARAVYELGKPNLSAMVAVSGILGFSVAGRNFDVVMAVVLAMGLWLTSAGACGLNMVVERDLDRRMRRTEGRPIPSGRLSARSAITASLLAFLLGFVLLFTFFGWRPAALSVFTALVYLFVYTPLKSKGPIATWVGAVPGAVPPVMGWAAATGRIELPSLALFSVLYFWQIPHFFALAWMYREDYRRGGFDFVPDGADRSIGAQMVGGALALLVASSSLVVMDVAGAFYAVGAALLGGSYFVSTLRLLGSRSPSRARSVFLWSIAYLPLLLVALVIDGWIR
ncbi:MAG: protoheme IX farnesyltransferase [Deltaproteobacteria bacterium]|nr:protoheme IX farnesyltransferase [Deltaproteobacteria bacterium]